MRIPDKVRMWIRRLLGVPDIEQTKRMLITIDNNSVQISRLVDQLAGQLDEVTSAARFAARESAQYTVNARRGELDAQERRVEEKLRVAESTASAITVAGSDLSVKLHEFIRQVTDESAHYSPRSNRWYGPGFEPWSASHPDTNNATEADTNE